MRQVSFILALLLTVCISSCNIVDIPIEPNVKPPIDTGNVGPKDCIVGLDTTLADDSEGYPIPDTSIINFCTRKVLVEEFTGHRCTGCPTETRRLLSLQEDLHPEVISVAYHEGTFAEPEPPKYPIDYRTDYGGQYHELYTPIFAYPSSVINRKTFPEFNNQIIHQAHDEWKLPINASANDSNLLFAIGIDAIVDPQSYEVKVRASIQAQQDISENHRIIFLCTEDKLVSAQVDNGVYVEDYVHRHVFRGQLEAGSGFYGAVLNDAEVDSGSWLDYHFEDELPFTVKKPLKCYVIALIINSTTSEVVQVEEVHVREAL